MRATLSPPSGTGSPVDQALAFDRSSRGGAELAPGALALAAWLALSTGLVEVVLLVVRTEIGRQGLYRKGPHFPWMIPASLLFVFVSSALPLWVVARLRPRWGSRVWTYPLFILALWALFLAVPGVRALGCLALACGLAAWLVPAVEARWAAFRAIVRFSLPAVAAIVLGLAVYSFARKPLEEYRRGRALPTHAAGAPNIMLVVMDTVRADALGLYGYHRNTSPNLTRLARRGVRFEQAIAPATWTLPSHASMFTGHWPNELSAGLNSPLDATYPTLAEFLNEQGYLTAGFAANTYFCNGWYGIDRGFAHYEDYVVTPLEILRGSALGYLIGKRLGAGCDSISRSANVRCRHEIGSDSYRKDADRINRDALAWLSRDRGNRPFFVFLNYLDAHDPYVTPRESNQHFGRKPETPAEDFLLRDWLGLDKRHVAPSDLALARDAYDDCIAYLDDRLGKLFQRLEQGGLLENTLVIITSDHGEHFGEHGLYGHRGSVYQPVTHVPLVVFGHQTIAPGSVVPDPVSLRDLPATIAAVLGRSGNSPFPGASLATHWMTGRAAESEPPVALFTYRSGSPVSTSVQPQSPDALASVIANGKAYIRNADGREELYDLATDPGQESDLAAAQASREVLENLRSTADQHLGNRSR
jgi:arylsulfatase A-like enzyme